jgi:hypothetical protein
MFGWILRKLFRSYRIDHAWDNGEMLIDLDYGIFIIRDGKMYPL